MTSPPTPASPDAAHRAREANRRAWETFQTADYATTLRYATEALEAARAAGERVIEAEAMSHLGHVHAGLGDYTAALGFQQQSVALLRELGHLAGLPRPMAGLANLYGSLGDHEAQRLVFQEALDVARAISDPQGVASALTGLGVAYLEEGRLEEALAWLERGVEGARRVGFAMVETVALDHLGRAHLARGDLGQARARHEAALARARETGNRKAEARQRQRLGLLLIREGRLPEARKTLEGALGDAAELGLPRLVEELHGALVEAHEALGDPGAALAHLKAQHACERARLSEEARQRVGVLSAQTREAWARREAEHARRQAEALARLAHHDALTGLANRAAFGEALKEAAARARAGERPPFAVLFVDLDGFKAVNDSFGHAAGDDLLVGVAHALRGAVPGGDLVARLGGDEFAVLAPSARTHDEAEVLARRLADALGRSLQVSGGEVGVTASIGVSVCPEDGGDGPTLLHHADLAMYEAKRAGKNALRRFAPEMEAGARERLLIEHGLRAALGRGEFSLHHQPQYELRTGARVGFEALLRWQPPGAPPVSPATFIAAAEDSGLIVPVGAWVLDAACGVLAAWRREGRDFGRLAVNVSPVQFAQEGFVAAVQSALARHHLDPGSLELELTERVVVRDLGAAARQFGALRDLGVRLALDDFGAGAANLNLLLRLPFDTLKLDRALVAALTTSDSAARVVGAVRALAHELRLEVVAEGVETPAQLAAARAAGCDRVQGYLAARPTPRPQDTPTRLSAPAG
ncbi:hypothetical protein DAETH_40110 (plasmid) [Deinococcus aetherius]|uniref:Diguanylate cyclase n=1 Tax=Deinococcus aetherius TaxID=200252 RepID=A0ABM8AJP4_9DEIO|nr:EAL domain-containing protein [Deinococcus aetherius]BDP44042.1 hypothetical protein DAETH_40110 [Deinococcus aetherius]